MNVVVVKLRDKTSVVEKSLEGNERVEVIAEVGTRVAREVLADEGYYEAEYDATVMLLKAANTLWKNVDMSDPSCPLANLFDQMERFLAEDKQCDHGDLRNVPKI
jgi:hypothetical protein